MKWIGLDSFICESGAELLKSLRAPEFIVPTLVMPVAFYSLFGVAMARGGDAAGYMLATFGVFAVMGPAIFGFGAGVAMERERGWLDLKRASPAPALSYISAKIFATMFFAFLALIPLYLVGGFLGNVELSNITWMTLIGFHLLASIPFIFLGLALGFTFSGNGSVAIANIIFLALSALGGLWIPIFVLPKFLQQIANFLPSFHAGEIALAIRDPEMMNFPPEHVGPLLVATGLFAVLAFLAWARQR